VVPERQDRLAEQAAFYDADAVAVNEWLESLRDERNRSQQGVAFRSTCEALTRMLDHLKPHGRILEIAAGTGRFSLLLAPHADELVLLDTSAISLEITQQHLAAAGRNAISVQADIFLWDPPAASYDAVCFAAWLHHVPLTQFDQFWSIVDAVLAPDGLVIFEFASSTEAGEPPEQPGDPYAHYHDPSREVSVRDLGGRRWRVVHRVWDPDALAARLRALGWAMQIELWDSTGFHWASARRRPSYSAEAH
jgi:SAM-dependent methyltransferase